MCFLIKCVAREGEGVEVATQAYLRATLLNRKHLPVFLQVICAAFCREVPGNSLSNHLKQQEIIPSIKYDQIHLFV